MIEMSAVWHDEWDVALSVSANDAVLFLLLWVACGQAERISAVESSWICSFGEGTSPSGRLVDLRISRTDRQGVMCWQAP